MSILAWANARVARRLVVQVKAVGAVVELRNSQAQELGEATVDAKVRLVPERFRAHPGDADQGRVLARVEPPVRHLDIVIHLASFRWAIDGTSAGRYAAPPAPPSPAGPAISTTRPGTFTATAAPVVGSGAAELSGSRRPQITHPMPKTTSATRIQRPHPPVKRIRRLAPRWRALAHLRVRKQIGPELHRPFRRLYVDALKARARSVSRSIPWRAPGRQCPNGFRDRPTRSRPTGPSRSPGIAGTPPRRSGSARGGRRGARTPRRRRRTPDDTPLAGPSTAGRRSPSAW